MASFEAVRSALCFH